MIFRDPETGILSDFAIGMCSTTCPSGHGEVYAPQLQIPFDERTVQGFQRTLELFVQEYSQACGSCGAVVRTDQVERLYFVYPFEDVPGTVVAWWKPGLVNRFQWGYAPTWDAPSLLAQSPKELAELVSAVHVQLSNDDCKIHLGRVFSIKTRWGEVVERFASRGKTALLDEVAPGLTLGAYRAEEGELGFRAMCEVLLPGFDPGRRHLQVAFPLAAQEWLASTHQELIQTHTLRFAAMVDLETAQEAVVAQVRRLELPEGVRLPDAREVAAEAVRTCRTLGEQATIALNDGPARDFSGSR
jgi:hypothetical protein